MLIIVFRSRVMPQARDDYAHWMARMSALAVTMPGYLSHKGFAAQDGEQVTIIEFESEAALRAWSAHPEHLAAKKKGRRDFYLEYRVQVCTLERESAYPDRGGRARAAAPAQGG